MKKLLLCSVILLAVGGSAFGAHDFTTAYRHPNIPEPHLVKADPPQTVHTFPALDTNNAFTGNNTFVNSNGYIYVGNATYACTPTGLANAITAAANGVVDATNCTGTISSTTAITINTNNVVVQLGTQTWSYGSGMGVAAITVNGNGVVFNCRPQQTIFTSATLGTTSPSVSSNIFLLEGNNDEVNDCVFQGQATNNANNFQVAINAQNNNQKIRRNTITGTTGTTGFNWGVNVQGSVSGHYIEQNIINQIMSKSDGTGFGIIAGNSPSQGFIRANNITFAGTGQLPIYISQATQNFEIADNVLVGGGTNQIKIASAVSGAANATSGNNVHNNILSGCTSCGPTGLIYLNSNAPNNKITNNLIIGGTGNTAQGIETDGGSSAVGTPDTNLIAGNKIQNVGEACVDIFASNKNIVEDNECRNPSTQTVGNYDPFVVVADGASNGAADNVFKGNVLQDGTFRSPLHIFSTTPLPARTVVIGNHFPCANGCIQDQGTGTVYGINDMNTAINGSGTNVPVLSGPLYNGGISSNGATAPAQIMDSSGRFSNGTATMGLTLKKGSGAGNYTNATTSYTVADSTNLCFTVTIPTGWKLGISAQGALATATAAVVAQAALTDNAACSTANAGILVETAPIQGAGISIADAFALDWVIAGDGNAHNIALQFKTSNASDTASLINSSATITPTMKFELMPSN